MYPHLAIGTPGLDIDLGWYGYRLGEDISWCDHNEITNNFMVCKQILTYSIQCVIQVPVLNPPYVSPSVSWGKHYTSKVMKIYGLGFNIATSLVCCVWCLLLHSRTAVYYSTPFADVLQLHLHPDWYIYPRRGINHDSPSTNLHRQCHLLRSNSLSTAAFSHTPHGMHCKTPRS